MFGKNEIEELRLQKELLVLQSDASRLLLSAELQRLQSPEFWRREAGQALRAHPMLTAVLGVGAGALAFKAVRKPGAVLNWLGGVGGMSSMALSAWKLFSRK